MKSACHNEFILLLASEFLIHFFGQLNIICVKSVAHNVVQVELFKILKINKNVYSKKKISFEDERESF